MTKVQLNEAGFIDDSYFDPATSTLGDVDGPASSTDGNLVVFDGTSGKKIKDGGAPAVGDVVGPALVTAGNIAVFDDTTGKLIADAGISTGALVSPIQSRKITISSAQILTSFSTPVELIPPPGTGKCVILHSVFYNFVYNSIAYGTNIGTYVSNGVNNSFSQFNIDGVTSTVKLQGGDFGMMGGNHPDFTKEVGFYFATSTGNPTAGNSTLEVTVFYSIMDV